TFRPAVAGHRLRREVIATVLSNAMINRGGPAFVNEIESATSADTGQIAAAYAVARDAFGLQEINATLDGLDNRVPGKTQIELYAAVEALLVRETLWFLRNESFDDGLQPLVDGYAEGIGTVGSLLPTLTKGVMADAIEA